MEHASIFTEFLQSLKQYAQYKVFCFLKIFLPQHLEIAYIDMTGIVNVLLNRPYHLK